VQVAGSALCFVGRSVNGFGRVFCAKFVYFILLRRVTCGKYKDDNDVFYYYYYFHFRFSAHIFCLAERHGGAAHPGHALLSFAFISSPVCRLNNPLTVHIPIRNVV
jgi:hypothetical protein